MTVRAASPAPRTVVIGAGIGGLAAALRLAAAGHRVTLCEAAEGPGGKLRTFPTPAGPADAGPTVFTMRPVFERLFADVGERLEDHLALESEPLLARHWWPDGSTLDLFSDQAASAAAIRDFAGPREADAFRRFSRDAAKLFGAFEGPVMHSARPDGLGIARALLRDPSLIPLLMPPRTFWSDLTRRFRDPRLRQLFGRYATYVGGSPFRSAALLKLIWQAEARGVWRIKGGMHSLAKAIAALAESRGAEIRYRAPVQRILADGGRASGVELACGTALAADWVVFNGDPAALGKGLLGDEAARGFTALAKAPRALSAYVWAFAAKAEGRPLAHHNLFFNAAYAAEFDAVEAGRQPRDATLYLCAQDRGGSASPTGLERFEIIMNGPAAARTDPLAEEFETCRTTTFETLAAQGLTLSPLPGPEALTTPSGFAALFPGTGGSLYGQSPHGMMAAFQRPHCTAPLKGLYLAGGGVHPGAGVPMATLSGQHAAAAILKRQGSISRSRQTAMRGGMSTGSPTMAPGPSRSSVS